jgi:hypothetical protein
MTPSAGASIIGPGRIEARLSTANIHASKVIPEQQEYAKEDTPSELGRSTLMEPQLFPHRNPSHAR